MNEINVHDITQFAFSEKSGLELRRRIEEVLSASENGKVTIDFSEVEVFTTMFFNASIGYFVLNRNANYVKDHFDIKHLSALGVETLSHSLNNAEIVAANKKRDLSMSDMIDIVKDVLDD